MNRTTRILGAIAVVGLVGLAAACAPAAPSPTPAPAKPAAEAPKPAAEAPKPAATTAPAPAAAAPTVAPAKPAEAKPQALVDVKYATRAQPSDPLFTFWTVAEKLGYFAKYGIKNEVLNLAEGETAVRAGQAQLSASDGGIQVQSHHDVPGYDLMSFIDIQPLNQARTVALPDSPLNSVFDLKGKTVGLYSQKAGGLTPIQAELRARGMDPDKDVNWVVIPPGPAEADAIKNKKVDAFVYYDVLHAQTEATLGMKLKILKHDPEFDRALGGVTVGKASDLKARRSLYVNYIRAFLMGKAFVDANLDAAAKIQLDTYPQLQGPSQSREDALKMIKIMVAARQASQVIPDWAQPKTFGIYWKEQWEPYVKIFGYKDFDVTKIYDNSLVEEAYQGLDLEAVRKLAKDYKN